VKQTKLSDWFNTAISFHRSGQLKSAEDLYREILRHQPNNASTLNMMGLLHFQKGQVQEGIQFIEKAISIDPLNPQFVNSLGQVFLKLGRQEKAKSHFQKAIELNPRFTAAHINLGKFYRKLGQIKSAKIHFEKVLELDPNNPSATNNLGIINQMMGNLDEAGKNFERLITLNPNLAEGYHNLGNIKQLKGKIKEAVDHHLKALKVNPQYIPAYISLGNNYQTQQQLKQAEKYFRKAIQLDKKHIVAIFSLGMLLKQQGRYNDAIMCFREILKIKPKDISALNNLGGSLQLAGKIQESITYFNKILELEPDHPEANYNLAYHLESQNELLEAKKHYEKALAANPPFATQIYFYLSGLLMKLADWSDYPERVNDLIERATNYIEDPNVNYHLPPLTLNVFPIPDHLRAGVVRKKAKMTSLPLQEIKNNLNFVHKIDQSEKLRIGYVSPDFRTHSVGALINEMFQYHNRNRYEIFAFSLVPAHDQITETIQQGVDHYQDISNLSTERAAKAIHDKGIHILIDLAGYTTYSRTNIFALEPAPVQAHYLGYLDTMGADFLPYIIADNFVLNEKNTREFTETVITLPHAFVTSFMEISNKPFKRKDFGLKQNQFVYCCFNTSQKISPEVFDVWMDILKAVPHGILWLFDNNSETVVHNLTREAKNRGITQDRLLFSGKLPYLEYLARYRCADLFLDTFTYNAGATAIGALKAGLPLLTCPGTTYMSRMGGSICQAAGLPEMVCKDRDEYRDRAIHLAQNPGELQAIKEKLSKNLDTVPLFDTKGFVSSLEKGFEKMWEKYLT